MLLLLLGLKFASAFTYCQVWTYWKRLHETSHATGLQASTKRMRLFFSRAKVQRNIRPSCSIMVLFPWPLVIEKLCGPTDEVSWILLIFFVVWSNLVRTQTKSCVIFCWIFSIMFDLELCWTSDYIKEIPWSPWQALNTLPGLLYKCLFLCVNTTRAYTNYRLTNRNEILCSSLTLFFALLCSSALFLELLAKRDFPCLLKGTPKTRSNSLISTAKAASMSGWQNTQSSEVLVSRVQISHGCKMTYPLVFRTSFKDWWKQTVYNPHAPFDTEELV